MSNIKELVIKLRSKDYYIKLIDILVINGLLDIIEEELVDGKIDYLLFTVNLITFLNANKKHYKNFSTDTFEKILILSIDEILSKKFRMDIDEEHIALALQLLRSSYLFKNMLSYIKNLLLKIYYKTKCKSCSSSIDEVSVISIKSSEQDSI